MRFPPIKLFGYDKAANSLLEKLRSSSCSGAISPEKCRCACLNCSLNGLMERKRTTCFTTGKTICSR